VEGMTHVFQGAEFTTTVTLSRNRKDTQLAEVSPQSRRSERDISSVLRNGGQWEAEVLESIYV
jgi:hypothetical protein